MKQFGAKSICRYRPDGKGEPAPRAVVAYVIQMDTDPAMTCSPAECLP